MSEARSLLFEPTFNRAVKVRKKDDRLTSDAGVLLLREVDERLELTAELGERLHDPRRPDRIRYSLVELLRERLYALAQGYRAQDDLDRLAHDPAFKAAVWNRPGQRVVAERLAGPPTQSRLLDMLAGIKSNLEALRNTLVVPVLGHQRVSGKDRAVQRGTIDIDGFPITVRGEQVGSAYNGYHGRTVYSRIIHQPLAAWGGAGAGAGSRKNGALRGDFARPAYNSPLPPRAVFRGTAEPPGCGSHRRRTRERWAWAGGGIQD